MAELNKSMNEVFSMDELLFFGSTKCWFAPFSDNSNTKFYCIGDTKLFAISEETKNDSKLDYYNEYSGLQLKPNEIDVDHYSKVILPIIPAKYIRYVRDSNAN